MLVVLEADQTLRWISVANISLKCNTTCVHVSVIVNYMYGALCRCTLLEMTIQHDRQLGKGGKILVFLQLNNNIITTMFPLYLGNDSNYLYYL